MNGYYFTPTDKRRIARMWAAYMPAELIAIDLHVNPATIHRELKRGNTDGELDDNKRHKYDPDLAQLRFQENLRRRGRRKDQTQGG